MSHRLIASAALALSSCTRGSPAASGEVSGTPLNGGGGSIRCTYAYRPTDASSDAPAAPPELEERTLHVGPAEGARETLGRLTLSARFASSESEGNSFSLTASSGEAQVLSALYQFGGGLPQNQFAGGHGFTGLLYFTHPTQGGDYQAFCEMMR